MSERRRELQRIWRQEHKDEIVQYNRQYRQDHKAERYAARAEIVTCECGCECTRHYLLRHRQTQTHAKRVSSAVRNDLAL